MSASSTVLMVASAIDHSNPVADQRDDNDRDGKSRHGGNRHSKNRHSKNRHRYRHGKNRSAENDGPDEVGVERRLVIESRPDAAGPACRPRHRRRGHRIARALAIAVAASVGITANEVGTLRAAACWQPPVDAAVADPFRPPTCPWCPGNRGIEYDTAAGDPVRAVAGGIVTYAGSIAGTFYLVVRHADGRRATYGGIAGVQLAQGAQVVRGMTIGYAAGRLHFGLRDGDEYVDPTPLLGYLVGRPRLVPADGAPARPAPKPVLRCGTRPPRVG